MKNILFLIVLAITSVATPSCESARASHYQEPPAHKVEILDLEGGYADMNILLIDSCEYIFYADYRMGAAIIHKANCPNPFHNK